MTKLKDKPETQTSGDMRNHNTRGMLLSFVERYERITEEIDGLTGDRKEIMAEAKGTGFDTRILREVIRRRKANSADIQEHDAVLELYEQTIREAEKAQLQKSEAMADKPAPVKTGSPWGKKAPPPAQMDVEELAPSQNEVDAEAARQIGAAADGKSDITPFLRRGK